MKKLLIVTATLFSFSAIAGWTTSAFTTSVSGQHEVNQVIAGINSGKIRVPGCGGQQKVYAYNYSANEGSFVADAHGNFRPVGSKATFKVRCRE